jgi:hypothetical protein
MTSSPAMHDSIAGDSSSIARDAWHHRRRCMTSSPATLLRSPAMHDIIAADA